MYRNTTRLFLGLAAAASLGGCAVASRSAKTAEDISGPREYTVVNRTSCYAKVAAVSGASTGGHVFVSDAQELSILSPGQTGTVTVPGGRRISVLTYHSATPTPTEPSPDCSRTGTVDVKRVTSAD